MANMKGITKQFRLVGVLLRKLNELIITMGSKMEIEIKEARLTEKYQSFY